MPHRTTLPALLLALLVTAACDSGDEKTYGQKVVDAYERGKASGARGDMQVISAAVTQYVTSAGDLPQAGDIHELAEILEPTHLRVVPREDPWGNPYEFSVEAGSFTIRSAGHDGELGNGDDIEVVDGQVIKMPDGFNRLQ